MSSSAVAACVSRSFLASHRCITLLCMLHAQVLPALAYAHQQGLAHGDLQLSRLLLHSSGSIKLGGFGSAARLADDGQPCTDIR